MKFWGPKVSCLLVCSLSPLIVWSDEALSPDYDTDIEQVKIIGSKMNQGLKEAAMSVTVYDREMIEEAGIRSLRDIDDFAANVSISQIGQVGGSYISIRGIESNPFIVNRTAVYVDGIPYRDPDMLSLNNVSQVEVLRGPQGTLYGSNADAGVIVISTQTPYQEFEAEAGIRFRQFPSGQSKVVDGRLSGGLTDKLTAILNVEVENSDSYVRNIGSSLGLEGKLKHITAGSKFRYQPNDETQLDVIVFYNRLDAPGMYEQEFPALNVGLYNSTYIKPGTGRKPLGAFEQSNDAPKKTNEREWGVALGFQKDIAQNQFHLSASYRREDTNSYGADLDLTSMALSAGAGVEHNRFLNLETRFSNLDGEGIDWVIGGTFYRDERQRQLMTLVGPGGFNDYIKASLQTLKPQSQAVFGQVIFPLSPKLTLTTGLRYERSSSKLEQQEGQLNLGALGTFSFPAVSQTSKDNEWVPKVSLSYELSEQTSVYTTVAKGFLPGGYNLVAADKGPEIARKYGPYEKESLWSYEAGFKSDVFEGKGFLSAAMFYIDASSWQEYNILTAPDGSVLSTTLVNSDASIISKGVEVELSTEVMEDLSMTMALGYIDAQYQTYHFSANKNYSNNDVKMVPKFDLSLSGTYQIDEYWYARADVQALGKTPLNQANSDIRPTLWLLGMSLGYRGENWTARLFGKNLTNKRYAAGLSYTNFLFGNDGNAYAPLANPRIIGFELSRRF